MENGYTVKQLDAHTWQIEEHNYRLSVYFYLLEGDTKAILIDSGLGNIPVRSIVEGLTKLPVSIINTHYHGDHIGANGDFEPIYLHPADRQGYLGSMKGEGPGKLPRPVHEETVDVREGDEIDLGGRTLRIYETPGHSAGSICILDVENRIMYTGDHCCRGQVLVFDKEEGLPGYLKSLEKVLELGDLYETTRPAHCEPQTEKEVLERLVALAKDIIAGKFEADDFENNFFKGYKSVMKDEIGFMFPPVKG